MANLRYLGGLSTFLTTVAGPSPSNPTPLLEGVFSPSLPPPQQTVCHSCSAGADSLPPGGLATGPFAHIPHRRPDADRAGQFFEVSFLARFSAAQCCSIARLNLSGRKEFHIIFMFQ
jgi:hypothetical protein